MNQHIKRLLDAQQASEYLGLAVGTIYNKSALGQIPSVKIGGALRFDLADLEKLIEKSKRQRPNEQSEVLKDYPTRVRRG